MCKKRSQLRGRGRTSTEFRDPRKGVRVWLGTFNTAVEAARAYEREARKIRGKKAKVNFPNEDEHLSAKTYLRNPNVSTQKLINSSIYKPGMKIWRWRLRGRNKSRKKQIEEEEEEERTRTKAREEEDELSRNQQVENENDGNEVDEWDYEEGPAEIIWQGNEIILKKKRVKIPKKNTDQQSRKDSDRPTSNPLPPQSEAFSDYKSSSMSAQQLIDSVAQQVPHFGTEQAFPYC
ncbi:hypothetical protein ACFX13_037054 [Malus domestica]